MLTLLLEITTTDCSEGRDPYVSFLPKAGDSKLLQMKPAVSNRFWKHSEDLWHNMQEGILPHPDGFQWVGQHDPLGKIRMGGKNGQQGKGSRIRKEVWEIERRKEKGRRGKRGKWKRGKA